MGKIWMLHVTVASLAFKIIFTLSGNAWDLKNCCFVFKKQNNGVCPASTHVRTKVRTHGTLN